MNAVSFDTLKFSRTLQDKAKLTPEQERAWRSHLQRPVPSK